MRTVNTLARFSLSASVIALSAAISAPASAQTPAPAQAPTQPDCSTIQDEAQRQACASAAEQVDPLANTGEADTTTGGASADSTQGDKGAIVVTGSRLRRDERTSTDPLTVIDPNVANREGRLNTAEVLQTNPLASGSLQITSAISSNFVINGGEGVENISLRGLGANRTLVLLNGRRAGPAGVRGGVSSFDLNVIPIEAIAQIDILKTGASSIYGSDAIAGVVNLITKKDLRGLQVRGFANIPTISGGGGGEKSLAALYGFGIGDRGHVMVGLDYYKRDALKRGDRSYLGCEEENVTSEATGERSDPVDPRTGEFMCGGFANSQIFLTDFFGAPNLCGPPVPRRPAPPVGTNCGPTPAGTIRRAITSIQFNYPGSRLDEFLPPLAPPGADFRNLVAPPGFFGVGAHTATALALSQDYNSQIDQDSIIPRTKRYTAFVEGGYDITDDINLYFEGLYNRRKTHTVAHGQLFFYQFAEDSVIGLPFYFCEGGAGVEACDPTAAGDPINTGFQFPGLLLPVVIRPFDSSTDVKYYRGVAGARADLSKLVPKGWADFYFQHSRSDGDYTRQITFRDAVEFGIAAWRTDACATNPNLLPGGLTPIRGVPCMDINYTDPRVLRGQFTPQEQAFLFGVDKGNTVYKQNTAELAFGGDVFQLPAGPLKVALGGQWRRDQIRDVPGEATLAGNVWGSTTSGITAGFQRTTELFGEVEVPVLRDVPGIKELTFNGAARLTNTYAKRTGPVCDAELNCVFDGASDSDKGNWTYKLAGNYSPTSWLRLRATYGTSFRSPALYEQFLANESGFLNQSQIDPCIRYENSQSTQLQTNCAAHGIPEGYLGAGGSAETFSTGGIGLLDPETSKALTLSAIFTPEGWLWDGGQFSFAVDYVDINVKDQVTQLGAANIVFGCYTSESFPTDPLCSLFERSTSSANEFSILTVSDPFLNIDQQHNKSLDFTTRFRQNLGNLGTLSLVGQVTYTLKDQFTLFQGVTVDDNGEVGDPKWVGDLNVTWTKNPITLTYGLRMIDGTNDKQDFIDSNGQPGPLPATLTPNLCLATAAAYALRGGPYCPVFKLPTVAYHSFSAEIQATKNFSFTIGMANIFNRKPPLVSTVGSPITNFAQVPLFGSYYDYIGRRVFVTARAKLGDMLGL